jgi:hypothetical protein
MMHDLKFDINKTSRQRRPFHSITKLKQKYKHRSKEDLKFNIIKNIEAKIKKSKQRRLFKFIVSKSVCSANSDEMRRQKVEQKKAKINKLRISQAQLN